MQDVLNQVNIVAPTNMTVVIQGESGTGKEVIANLIHKKSLRKDKPLVAIDCGAIPETLIESELFGYEKGAFTGADSQKEGKFEQANEGTLFLDEITNLSDGNQTKLLRVIQEKKVNRLGGKKDHKVDVRIVCATNTRLIDNVKEGKFRSDLYYRLNEFHINLPLLKDRKDDIPLFVKYFTQDANSELNKNVKSFSAKAMKSIMTYTWPGNVRELRNVIRRSVLMSQSEIVDYLPLPEENLELSDDIDTGEILKEKSSLDNYTKQFERDLIMKALQEAGGNKTKAAKILNMNERTFYRKIKNLGL
jgi:transcriptional regulator with PAS, ATPase and Fis domain